MGGKCCLVGSAYETGRGAPANRQAARGRDRHGVYAGGATLDARQTAMAYYMTMLGLRCLLNESRGFCRGARW